VYERSPPVGVPPVATAWVLAMLAGNAPMRYSASRTRGPGGLPTGSPTSHRICRMRWWPRGRSRPSRQSAEVKARAGQDEDRWRSFSRDVRAVQAMPPQHPQGVTRLRPGDHGGADQRDGADAAPRADSAVLRQLLSGQVGAADGVGEGLGEQRERCPRGRASGRRWRCPACCRGCAASGTPHRRRRRRRRPARAAVAP